jgi:hypothetical protein
MQKNRNIALVVTTIQAPNAVMRSLAAGAQASGAEFIVMGDKKSPAAYHLDGAKYYSLEEQYLRFGEFGRALPAGHYVRKNLGYLAALDAQCGWIVETDDDNFPLEGFFREPPQKMRAARLQGWSGWANAYQYFSPSSEIWPRGFPLELLALSKDPRGHTVAQEETPVIVQGLANENPDVDAVFRLTRSLPVSFDNSAPPLSLDAGIWCPFNSQNTWFRRDHVALCYLPSHCSFRMTDIWRSFVAQRCLWETPYRLIFSPPTVRQERNEHNLLRDFADEVPGYLNNARIAALLSETSLSGSLHDDIRRCYWSLSEHQIFPPQELALVDSWLTECEKRGC